MPELTYELNVGITGRTLNTAIEVTIDRIGKEIHPLSGLAKDLGSAAVLVTIAISSLLWLATLCRYF